MGRRGLPNYDPARYAIEVNGSSHIPVYEIYLIGAPIAW
jgi:hypothetical protein